MTHKVWKQARITFIVLVIGVALLVIGSPAAHAQDTVNVTLSLIGSDHFTVDEGSLLKFDIRATDDLDVSPDVTVSNKPKGAVFTTANVSFGTTGTFSWTPAEDQNGSIYKLTFVARAYFPLFGEEWVSKDVYVKVNEVNVSPVMLPIAPITINEANIGQVNDKVSFTLSATDSDLPAQTLAYSAPNLPEGATLNPTTGEFNWSPNELQGGVAYNIVFIVTDNGSPQYKHSRAVAITVNEYNEAPEIPYISIQTVDETELMSFVVEAVDPDMPAQTMTYRIEDLPAGASFDTASGEFIWQTTESDGGTSGYLLFVVSDPGGKYAFRYVEFAVNEVNSAPVLAHIPDVVGQPGEVITFTLSATDGDLPADTLAYSVNNAPVGMTLDPVTGVVNWAIEGSSLAGMVSVVSFTVTDDGTPNLSDSQDVVFTVEAENLLKNAGFQESGKKAKQAKNWKGSGLLPGDKRICKPISETEWNCEFQFSATPAKATNRKLRQNISTDTLVSGDTVKLAGTFRANALTKGAKVQMVAKLADGQTKRATVKLITGDGSNAATIHGFEQSLSLTAAPVEMWLEISTGKSSGKLFVDNLLVMGGPSTPSMATETTDVPALIPVPAAPDLRGGAAIGMGQ